MKTVVVTGSFDVFHIGHARLLAFASSLGDRLIVLIDSDNRIQEKKGKARPVFPLGIRIEMLSHFFYIDNVTSFDTDDELITLLNEGDHIRVVGHEYEGKDIIGKELASEIRYFTTPRVTSSTEIINKLNGQ